MATSRRVLVALLLAAGILVAGVAPPPAAGLTTEGCLAKKLKEWGKLRKCQAVEDAKALQGKPADRAKCQTKFDTKLAAINSKAAAADIACRYRDNGDQTVTDYDTGLQWEKKDNLGGIHDVDDAWQWSVGGPPYLPSGAAFSYFVGALNFQLSDGSGCFGNHCDWRLPTHDELTTIVDSSHGLCAGGSGGCIDPIFGPTALLYWSLTTESFDQLLVDYVSFGASGFIYPDKTGTMRVRAVRRQL